MANTNRIVVPEAKKGLEKFKFEVASELGLANYKSSDMENQTSRLNGSVGGKVGGTMVKQMVEQYERNLQENN